MYITIAFSSDFSGGNFFADFKQTFQRCFNLDQLSGSLIPIFELQRPFWHEKCAIDKRFPIYFQDPCENCFQTLPQTQN